MNWIDFIILGVVTVSLIAGFMRGAIKTIFALAGVVFGFLLASRESGAVGMVLENWMSEEAAAVAGFVLVFAGVAIVFGLAGWLLRTILSKIFLGGVDRVLGLALGLLKAGVVVGVFALALEALGPLPAARRSITFPYALEAGKVLLHLIPDDTAKRLHLDGLRDRFPREEQDTEVI